MSNDLLHYYQQELLFLRQLGAEFAAAHPKIAGRLRLNNRDCEDPHVERIIEAFALLTAGIRHKLDDDFSEISDALINILYPHYQSPIPAMGIVQLQYKRDLLRSRYEIKPQSLFESEPAYGEICYFNNCYPVTLWPIDIIDVQMVSGALLSFLQEGIVPQVACLHLTLKTCSPELSFAELDIEELRFYINLETPYNHIFYELIFQHTTEISIGRKINDKNPIFLGINAISTVGFTEEEGLLPYPNCTPLAYRLLTEYCFFAEKFNFFRVKGFNTAALQDFGHELHLYLHLSKTHLPLEQTLNKNHLLLGCTPLVNIFRQLAEPLTMQYTATEYLVVPDARRTAQAIEIHKVEKVFAVDADGKTNEFMPFYAKHQLEQARYWSTTRKPACYSTSYQPDKSEVFISFTDLSLKPHEIKNLTIFIETLCTNHNLPSQLPVTSNQTILRCRQNHGDLIANINCLTTFTTSHAPYLGAKAKWRLLSHLALNHLSFLEKEYGLFALKETLLLYSHSEKEITTAMIESLLTLNIQPTVMRKKHLAQLLLIHGHEIILTIDENNYSSQSIYLFGCVLEHFFALYTSINSFTQLIIHNKHHKELYRWPARSGIRARL